MRNPDHGDDRAIHAVSDSRPVPRSPTVPRADLNVATTHDSGFSLAHRVIHSTHIHVKQVEGPRTRLAHVEPQHCPGVHPWADGEPPQHVEPPACAWPVGELLTEIAAADISFSSWDPPHEAQTRSSEFLPIPTRSSLTLPHSVHLYSWIGITFPFFGRSALIIVRGLPNGQPSRSSLLLY